MVDKRIKYILYILMIISLFFTIKNKVKADTIEAYYIQPSLLQTNFQIQTLDGVNKSYDFQFTDNLLKNYDYVQGSVAVQIQNSTLNVDLANIDFETTCTNQQNYGGTSNLVGTITYADNTQADVYISYIQKLCNKWETTGRNSTATIEAFDNHPYINVSLLQSNGDLRMCETNSNGNFKCKLGNNFSIRYIRVSIAKAVSPNVNAMVFVNRQLMFYNDSSTSIVNSINNQNTQQHQDSQNTQNKIDNIDNTIKDSSTDNQKAQQTFDSLNSNMATNSTISDLLLMPIHLLQKVLNGLQGSCSSINLGELLGTDFILPCINISDIIGSTLWGIIDVICSGFLAYHIGKRFVVIFNQFTNLKEGGLESAYD